MKRFGYTLIEVITVMAAMGIIMGITVVLFVQLFDFQRNNDEYADQMRAVNRFASDFRGDVRTYGKPEIVSDGTALLRWKTEAETVEYTVKAGEFPEQQIIVRTAKEGGNQRSETYQLPDWTSLRVVDGSDDDAGLIALSLWTAPQGTDTPNLDELNPFDRTVPKSLEQRIDPKYAGNWRTIIVRY